MDSEFYFEPMDRQQSKLSVAVYGPSGSGKTVALLKLAKGIRDQLYPGEDLSKIGLFIDTERRSSTKSVGRSIGGDVLEPMELYAFEPPFEIETLARLIDYAINVKGKKIIVVDSYTAFWSGMDGILEKVSELDVKLDGNKKAYGAWSEQEIIHRKNVLKNLMTNADAHMCFGFRAKTEYVLELNARGKMAPRAIGLKEDMQADVRFEFDSVLSIDKETHGISVVKDRIGYKEYRDTSENPESPITVEDGKVLAKLVSEGLTLEEVAARKRETYIRFILNEKAHKATKAIRFEVSQKISLDKDYLEKLPYERLEKLVKFLKG